MSVTVYRPGDEQAVRSLPDRIFTILSPEFSTSSGIIYTGVPASAPWFSANAAVAYPFRMSYPVIAKQLCICHGSAAGGNFDIGLFDGTTFALLTSSGSTGAVNNNSWQFVDVADVTLLPQKVYYLAASRDNTTANRQRIFTNLGAGTGQTLAGTLSGASQFPLPDPLVVGAAATSSAQAVGMACKVPY